MKVFTIVKVAVVNEAGEVLLLKRGASAPRRAGQWDLPGGYVEPSEELQTAAARETLEETGLIVAAPQLVYCFTELDDSRFGSGNWLTFKAKVQSPKVTLSYEHDDYQWVIPSALSEYITYNRQQRMFTYLLDNNLLGAA
jgi:8-oxo-dGTP diphosphatase